jgi:hypothetical protein
MWYDPVADPPIDFTWEREWRVLKRAFEFTPDVAGLVVPNHAWADRLIEAHHEQQDWQVFEYAQIFDRAIAEMYREPFRWNVFPLSRDR